MPKRHDGYSAFLFIDSEHAKAPAIPAFDFSDW
jgi:hypothetical protein